MFYFLLPRYNPRLSPLGLRREEPCHGDDTVCTKTVVGMVLLGFVYAPLRSRFSSIRTPRVLLLLVRPRLFPMGNDPFSDYSLTSQLSSCRCLLANVLYLSKAAYELWTSFN